MADVDGDGVTDYYLATPSMNTTGRYATWYRGAAVGAPAADLLTSVTTPLGGTISLTYASSGGFGSTANSNLARQHRYPVVSTVTIQGIGLSSRTISRTYANPTAAPAPDDPNRLEVFGFADTYEQDSATNLVRHDRWGTTHETMGRVLLSETGTQTAPGSTYVAPTFALFDSAAHSVTTCPIGTTQFPTEVVDLGVDHKWWQDGSSTAFENLSTAGTCSNVDIAGNILSVQQTRDVQSPADNITIFSVYPDPKSSSVQCKTCALEVYAKGWAFSGGAWSVNTSGPDLFHRRYHYDAPVGSFDPAPIAVGAGHLNYVEELVAWSGSEGVYEVSPRTKYNADGTAASMTSVSAGSNVTSVVESYTYDAFGLAVTSIMAQDNGTTQTTLTRNRTYDQNTGWLTSESAQYLGSYNPTPPVSWTLYQYDTFGRIIGIGRKDSSTSTPYQLAMKGYSAASGTTPASSWTASFANGGSYPLASVPGTDDVTVATSYFDSAGRTLQTRVRFGGSAAAGGNIAQHLSTEYLVSAAIYDAAGRVSWTLDPYYSNTASYEDLTGTSPPALNTSGLHGTGYTYDARGRQLCSSYSQISGSLPAPSCATSVTSSVRATQVKFGTYKDSTGRQMFTIASLSDSQTSNPPSNWPTSYMDAGGLKLYESDAGANFVAFTHTNLGQISGWTRYSGAVGTTPAVSFSRAFDGKGRVVSEQDDSSGIRLYTYASSGQLIQVASNPSTVTSDLVTGVPQGIEGVQFAYGSLGRLASKTPYRYSAQPASSCSTTLTWTKNTFPATTYSYDSATPVSGSPLASYAFTAGRLSSISNSVATIGFSYDAGGNIVEKDEVFGGLTGMHAVQLNYRSDGALTSTTISSPSLPSQITYSTWYDSVGRVVAAKDPSGNAYWSALPIGQSPSSPVYDSLGRLGTQWLDNGAGVKTATFDPASNLLTAYSTAVTPTGSSQQTNLLAASAMTYTGSKLSGYSESVAQTSFQFAYDGNDRLSSASATPQGGATSALKQSFSEVTSLNGFGNLTTATDSVAQTTATWNRNASSIGELVPSIQYTANANGVTAPGMDSFTYDSFGRETYHQFSSGTVRNYAYDPEARLTSITGPNNATLETISYDPVGALAVRVLATGTRYYAGEALSIHEGNTGFAHVFVSGVRLASVSSAGVIYYHRDRLGSVVATSTASGSTHGQLGAQYRYSTYGVRDPSLLPHPGSAVYASTAGEASSNASELGYTGALVLSDDLVYLNARVYSASARRFLQPDNIDPQRFAYVGSDPVNRTDPTGRMYIPEENMPRGGGGSPMSSQQFWATNSSYYGMDDADYAGSIGSGWGDGGGGWTDASGTGMFAKGGMWSFTLACEMMDSYFSSKAAFVGTTPGMFVNAALGNPKADPNSFYAAAKAAQALAAELGVRASVAALGVSTGPVLSESGGPLVLAGGFDSVVDWVGQHPYASAGLLLGGMLTVAFAPELIAVALSGGGGAAALQFTQTVENHLNDVTSDGDLARPYMSNPALLIEEIQSASPGVPDQWLQGALRYDVPGTMNGSSGTWQLVINPTTNTVYHFCFVGGC